jgi:hypothetical protein
VDGKQICRNLVMLPFCTTTPSGVRRHDWREIAIEVPLNINNSEVRISGVRNNDFNIIFVLSDQPVEESKGFDYFESFVFDFKHDRIIDDVKRAPMHTNKRNAESGQEYAIELEHEPLGMFAYNLQMGTDIINSDFPSNKGKQVFLPDYTMCLSVSDNEDMPTNINLALVSCTEKIPHKQAYYEFPNEPTHKHIIASIKTNSEGGGMNIADTSIICAQTILFFKSKQLA